MNNTSRFILRLSLLLAIFSSSFLAHALPQHALVPGGIVLLEIPDYQLGTKVYLNNKRLAVFHSQGSWLAMAGISLSTKPGSYVLSVRPADGSNFDSTFTVSHKKYDEQHLTIKNKRKVNPNERDTQRISKEYKRKAKARKQYSEKPPTVDFVWPVNGRISSIFGLRRFFNEQERRPHSGLDIAAAEGTPIIAVADGTVIDTGDFFFSGNMIYLDHGQGIVTLYAHLSKISVKPGDKIKQGEIIGLVGQTGRVTGPHLHFAVYANQTLIDPIFMLPADGNLNADQANKSSVQSGKKSKTSASSDKISPPATKSTD